jgi:hypothetical protein
MLQGFIYNRLKVSDKKQSALKVRRKLSILRKLSETKWRASGNILSKVYQQGIHPHLEYGSSAWCPASNNTLQELDKVQNHALRIIMMQKSKQ